MMNNFPKGCLHITNQWAVSDIPGTDKFVCECGVYQRYFNNDTIGG